MSPGCLHGGALQTRVTWLRSLIASLLPARAATGDVSTVVHTNSMNNAMGDAHAFCLSRH